MVFDQDVGRTPAGGTGHTWVTWGDVPALTPTDDWQATSRAALRALPDGGLLAGYFGYEAGRWCERMPPPISQRPLPDIWLRPTQGHARLDHATGRWTVHGTPRFRTEWHAIEAEQSRKSSPSAAGAPELTGPHRHYESAVEHALDAIRDGEVYQVNLSWEASALALTHPLDTWLDLRSANPARRGAFITIDDRHAILSNSPETFVDVVGSDSGTWAEARPIKGTVPLAAGPQGRAHLLHSEKERAELAMIVDLVRNDLGRVARWGEVETGERYLRECGDLLHAEQRVRARVLPELDALDVIAASFPPGSVTGAPKVRAMSLIRDLEPVPRGVYTGAIGWLTASGDAHFNVAIRTITSTPSQARFHLGAGIVADSIPSAEWAETLAKGRSLHQAIQRATRAR